MESRDEGCCKVARRQDKFARAWVNEAVRQVEADSNRSADTHLHVFPLPPHWGIDLYLKDESVHPTGSLKHRLARSLFLYALCNGWIDEGTTIIEASSGSTAVSEAYFARLLGLPFVAVMPSSTSREKIELTEFYGGRCHLVEDPGTIYDESKRLAAETGGPLGVGELVHVVATGLGRQPFGLVVDRARILDQVATTAVELDQLDLLPRRAGWHHRDERETEQPGEVRLGHRGRPRRRLDDRRTLVDPPVAQGVEEQRPREPVLQRSGGVHRLVLEVQVDPPRGWQREHVKVRVRGAVAVRLDLPDRLVHPGARELVLPSGYLAAALVT